MTAPRDRTYHGHRTPGQAGPGAVVKVDASTGKADALDPRYDLREHSLDGFQWGYGGSGPSQLALALVADATGDSDLAMRTYQRFKFEIVVNMADDWILEAGVIADFAKSLDKVVVP